MRGLVLVGSAALASLLAGCSGDGGSGGSSCSNGAEGCPCYGNGTCDGALTCASNLCVSLGSGGTSGSGGSGTGGSPSGGGSTGTGGASQLVGKLSRWQTTTNLPVGGDPLPRRGCAFAAEGFLFYVHYRLIGGTGGLVETEIFKTQQNADGTLGPWSLEGSPWSFSAKFFTGGLQCAYGNGYVFLLESDLDDQFVVRSAPVQSAGGIGAFSDAVTFPPGFAFSNPLTQEPGLLVHNGNLILSAVTMGGSSPVPAEYATVKGTIQPDGSVGSFNVGMDWGNVAYTNPSVTSFAGPTLGWSSFIYKMGTDKSARVWFMDETSGGWTDTTQLPAPNIAPRAAVWEGFVFLFGGSSWQDADRVYASGIHPDGVVGNWSETSSIPQQVLWGAAMAANGYVYYLGGVVSGSINASTVYFAKVE